jgi:ABC-type protease/lipase transport system fused ATPase/permease subunit
MHTSLSVRVSPIAASSGLARRRRELGLRDLIDRKPSGLMQIVGETGWQLSHGERSRLFLARVLLQKMELVVLDGASPRSIRTRWIAACAARSHEPRRCCDRASIARTNRRAVKDATAE